MKDHALKKIAEHTSGKKFIASDATWVLIVPAIWSASAKQFMREAAKEVWMIKIFMLLATGSHATVPSVACIYIPVLWTTWFALLDL